MTIPTTTPTYVIMTRLAEKLNPEIVADWMFDTEADFVAKHTQEKNDEIINFLKSQGVSKDQIDAIN